MSAQPSSLPLKTAVTALSVSTVVFLIGNLILYMVLYPPVTAPAAVIEPTAAPAVVEAAPTLVDAAPAVNLAMLSDAAVWTPISGDWAIDGTGARQTRTDGFDYLLVYTSALEQPQLDVQFAHDQGIGAGVMFNLPQPDRVNGGHLVRYLDAQTLIWGYFDAAGGFVAQGTAAVNAPGTDQHRLQISASTAAYTITLDNTLMAENIPLMSLSGYAALSMSQTAAHYTSAAIQGTPTETTFTSMSGDWVRENGLITQRSLDTRDFLTASGIQGERYTVTVEITLPTAADVPAAGGGLVFHMKQRDSLSESQMVRLHQNGQEILWGWYDTEGVFQYEGGQVLPTTTSQTRTLTLVVRGAHYDILVDGAPVSSDLTVRSTNGYIGLLSYRGDVSFANFRLVIGAAS